MSKHERVQSALTLPDQPYLVVSVSAIDYHVHVLDAASLEVWQDLYLKVVFSKANVVCAAVSP